VLCAPYPVWIKVLGRITDISHEGAEADVLTVAQHVNSILASLLGPVTNITGAIALVVTFDLGL
jgi:type IV secretory pathway VirB2 component (pilin)